MLTLYLLFPLLAALIHSVHGRASLQRVLLSNILSAKGDLQHSNVAGYAMAHMKNKAVHDALGRRTLLKY